VVVRYALLGPIDVRLDGRAVEFSGVRQRAVLAMLLLRANQTVSIGQLCDALWDVSPAAAESNVRTYVARLRQQLGEARLLTRHRGYQLVVAAGELDSAEFEDFAERGRQAADGGDLAAAVELFDRALGLWRGQALEDVEPGPLLRSEMVRLAELHLAVVEQHAGARIELGEHEPMVGELKRLVADHPTREGLAAQLMLALYRCGRQAEALDAFAQARQRLVSELGIEPGVALRAMQQRVLAADPGLEAASTADRVNALPMDIADFTGRQAELTGVRERIADAARRSVVVCAVTGMAGVGKTRLAVHVAHELVRRGQFDEVQLWADLRGFDPESPPVDPAGVLEGFLGLLGVPRRMVPADPVQRAALYRDRLAGRRALVLLDNAADEEQVRPLLPGSPGCLVLVTSRRELPDLDGVSSVRLGVFSDTEALSLLGRIAGTGRIAAEPEEADRVVRLCGHLPIAVTLAAQRLRGRPSWTVATLAGKLDAARLSELHGRSRAIRAAFDLSYQALPDEVRRVFRLLGLHPADDFSPHSVAALADREPGAAEEILESLLDEHLLQQATPGRYRLHDLLRLYARERAVAEEPDPAAAVRRLLVWYLHTAESASRVLNPNGRPVPLEKTDTPAHLPAFPTRAEAGDWCEAERASLVNVVRAAAERGEHAIAWQLPCALLSFYYLRKHWDDWALTHRTALDAARKAGDVAGQARVLNNLGVAHSDLGRHDEAIACHVEARPLFREVADILGEAWNLNNLGVAYDDLRRFGEAADCYRDALSLFRASGEVYGESLSMCNLGDTYRQLGQTELALTCLRQALDTQRRSDDLAGQRYTLRFLGDLHRDTGRRAKAIAEYRQALVISRGLGDRRSIARLLDRLAGVLHGTGRASDAQDCWLEAHTILTELGDPEAETIRARAGR
jgi:DNA-binding SARP family transcriptional activator